ncbi:MAG: nucleoside hydrolase [Acidobacteriota bacterium]|nr:nucleoside hydrolase [Acidobacteriota bacterium]
MRRWARCSALAVLAVPMLAGSTLAQQRLVLVDQDGSGPAGSNQMAMLALLNAPHVQVLGITMVSGNAWEPEEVQHTLRMLELTHHTDVPVVPGAIYPLVRDEAESRLQQSIYGTHPWYGAWGDLAQGTSRQPYHAPLVVPPLQEGSPTTQPLAEDAAHFLIRQVHAHPHQVTVYAAGPLTNIALALRLDPEFASLSQGLVVMGGSVLPQTTDPEFANNPRHEFNFWFDPEAAHIVLHAPWPRVDLTTVDISIKTQFTRDMLTQIASAHTPSAEYLAAYTGEFYYLWDELAAVAWLDPKIITREQLLYVDVDLTRGPGYGDTLTWTATSKPATGVQLVHVQQDLDTAAFYREFITLMQGR